LGIGRENVKAYRWDLQEINARGNMLTVTVILSESVLQSSARNPVKILYV